MFKARKKDIRRRPMNKTEDVSDDEGNVSDASVGTVPAPAPAPAAPPGAGAGAGAGAVGADGRPKKMRKKSKGKVDKGPRPMLSFGHEDEEESGMADKVGKEAKVADSVFRVKKSKASKVSARRGDWGGGWVLGAWGFLEVIGVTKYSRVHQADRLRPWVADSASIGLLARLCTAAIPG